MKILDFLSLLLIPCLAVFAGHGDGARDGAAQLDDVSQVVLVPTVVLAYKQSINQPTGQSIYRSINQPVNQSSEGFASVLFFQGSGSSIKT